MMSHQSNRRQPLAAIRFRGGMKMEHDQKHIKIHVLHCGTIRLQERLAYSGKGASNRRIRLPVSAYLVEHPVHGNLLIEAGLSADCRALFSPHLNWFYDPHVEKGQTAVEQLAEMGLRSEDIDLLMITHNDADHTCAIKDFAGRAKRIVMPELEYFYSCRSVFRVRQSWKTYIPYEGLIERPSYYGTPLGPACRGFDLFGDDSVLCLLTPGHTEGQMMVMLNKAPSARFTEAGAGNYGGPYVIFAADAAISHRNIDDLVVPGFGFNRHLQREALKWLKEQKADPNCKAIFCSHDPDIQPQTIEI